MYSSSSVVNEGDEQTAFEERYLLYRLFSKSGSAFDIARAASLKVFMMPVPLGET